MFGMSRAQAAITRTNNTQQDDRVGKNNGPSIVAATKREGGGSQSSLGGYSWTWGTQRLDCKMAMHRFALHHTSLMKHPS